MFDRFGIQMVSFLKNLWPSCDHRQELNDDREKIVDIIKPIIMTATFFGLIPNSVKFSQIRQLYEPVPKSMYLSCFRGTTFILLDITFLILHIYLVFVSAGSTNFANLPKRLNYIFENINFLIVCLLAYGNGFLHRKKYSEILNKIICAWAKLPSTKTDRIILKKIFAQCFVILMGIALSLLIFIYLNSYQDSKLWKLVIGMSLYMPHTIQLVYHGFYTVLVLLLSTVLSRITDSFKSPPRPVSVIDVRPKQRYLALVYIRSLYIEVYEIKMTIMQTFKTPLIYSILQSFHSFIAESYFIYYGILYSKNIPTYLIYTCAFWIFSQIMKVYSLSYSGNLLKHEASRFAVALLALPTEGQDIRWFMEVQNFSTLLKYMSMEISLYGFFPLDNTLLLNVFATALTYLIILAQFAE